MTSKISKKNNIFSFIFFYQNNFAGKKCVVDFFSQLQCVAKENWVNVYQIIILFFRKFEAIIRIQKTRKKNLLTWLFQLFRSLGCWFNFLCLFKREGERYFANCVTYQHYVKIWKEFLNLNSLPHNIFSLEFSRCRVEWHGFTIKHELTQSSSSQLIVESNCWF